MSERITIESMPLARKTFVGRVAVAGCLVLVMTLGLVLRYFWLQVLHYEDYRTQSERNRVHLRAISPTRGLIYDRNGVLLADNRPSSTLVVIREQAGDLDAALQRLGELVAIDERDVGKFRKRLASRRRPYEQVPLKFQLTEREIAVLAVNRFQLPGFEVRAELARHYPFGHVFAHGLGYVGRINERELQRIDPFNYEATHVIGKTGVEKYYETLLHGTVGHEHVETNARGRVLRSLDRQDPQPGQDLILSLDTRVQQAAVSALGQRRGAVVAIDPHNGGVIAFASTPGFDPNLFVRGISTADYRALSSSPDLPLYNRAVLGQYPPGSTVKPILGLGGLSYGVITAATAVSDPGWYQLPRDSRRYRDWKRSGHGSRIDLHTAVEQSCDVFYYHLAFKMGIDRMQAFGDLFGLGRVTGIDLPAERAGLLPSREWKQRQRGQVWYPGETLSAGIGQGYMLATPLQLAVSTAAIASRGRVHTPRLLKSVSGEVPPVSGGEQRVEAGDAHWDLVWSAMEAVVHGARGTAKGIATGLQYRVAGKTGTAQVIGIAQGQKYDAEQIAERNRDHALFVAFAPLDDPRIAVAVIVENGEHGSTAAAPVARQVMDAYLLSEPALAAAQGGGDAG